MKSNKPELINLSSKSESVSVNKDNLRDVLNKYFDTPSFVTAYLDYKVLIGRYEKNTFLFYNNEEFENKYIQKLRIFNEDREVLIWRTNNGFKGRLRTDNEGTETDIVVAYQVLFGTKGENRNEHFTEIKEDRGTCLILPFGNLTIVNKRNLICIKTHNYVEYNAVCQASYVDCRFVGFYQCNGDKKTALS